MNNMSEDVGILLKKRLAGANIIFGQFTDNAFQNKYDASE
jgi:hypothetical protein